MRSNHRSFYQVCRICHVRFKKNMSLGRDGNVCLVPVGSDRLLVESLVQMSEPLLCGSACLGGNLNSVLTSPANYLSVREEIGVQSVCFGHI